MCCWYIKINDRLSGKSLAETFYYIPGLDEAVIRVIQKQGGEKKKAKASSNSHHIDPSLWLTLIPSIFAEQLLEVWGNYFIVSKNLSNLLISDRCSYLTCRQSRTGIYIKRTSFQEGTWISFDPQMVLISTDTRGEVGLASVICGLHYPSRKRSYILIRKEYFKPVSSINYPLSPLLIAMSSFPLFFSYQLCYRANILTQKIGLWHRGPKDRGNSRPMYLHIPSLLFFRGLKTDRSFPPSVDHC